MNPYFSTRRLPRLIVNRFAFGRSSRKLGKPWDDPAGILVTSSPLFDATLETPSEPGSAPILLDRDGPDGGIRVAHQHIALQDGTFWWVSTAESLGSPRSESGQLLNSRLISFGLVLTFGVLGAAYQVSTALKPLAKLRDEVLDRWDRGETIDPTHYPDEVAPLIDDINAVIWNNRQIIYGAGRQAADLAHALKT